MLRPLAGRWVVTDCPPVAMRRLSAHGKTIRDSGKTEVGVEVASSKPQEQVGIQWTFNMIKRGQPKENARSGEVKREKWPPTEEMLQSMTLAEFNRRWEADQTRHLARSIRNGPSVTFARLWPMWTLNIALVVVVTLLITWKGWSLPRLWMAMLLYSGTATSGYILLRPWFTARRHGNLCGQQLQAVERHLDDDPSEAGDFLSALKAIQSPLSGESEVNRRYAATLYQRALRREQGSLPIATLGPQYGTDSLPTPSAPASDPA